MATEYFLCPTCDGQYREESSARFCCDVHAFWECDVCSEGYDNEESAESCCEDEADDDEEDPIDLLPGESSNGSGKKATLKDLISYFHERFSEFVIKADFED